MREQESNRPIETRQRDLEDNPEIWMRTAVGTLVWHGEHSEERSDKQNTFHACHRWSDDDELRDQLGNQESEQPSE